MLTRSNSPIRLSALWLMLIAVVCLAVLPGVAVAKVHRTIEMEGDPGDGVEGQNSGGGSSIEDVPPNGTAPNEEYHLRYVAYPQHLYFPITIFIGGTWHCNPLVQVQYIESFLWGAVDAPPR